MSPASHGAAARGLASNRTLGEATHDAIEEAGRKKADALRAKKKAERYFDIAFIAVKDAKNADERRAKARLDPNFTKADDDHTEAECAAIVAKAEADAMEVRFDEWRTNRATERAEMNLR